MTQQATSTPSPDPPKNHERERLFTFLRSIDRWYSETLDQIDDMESWRDKLTERVYYAPWKPLDQNLQGDTIRVLSCLATLFPSLDPKPIQEVYDFIERWHADHNAERLPPQVQINEIWRTAWMMLSAVNMEVHERILRFGASPSQPKEQLPPLSEGELEVYKKLKGRVMTGKELSQELERTEDLIRKQIENIRRSGRTIKNRPRRGYYRPEAPPSDHFA